MPALIVESAGDTDAIGQVNLLELVALDADKAATAIEDVNGAPVHRLRGSLLPLVHLAAVLGVELDRKDGHVLIAVLQAEGDASASSSTSRALAAVGWPWCRSPKPRLCLSIPWPAARRPARTLAALSSLDGVSTPPSLLRLASRTHGTTLAMAED